MKSIKTVVLAITLLALTFIAMSFEQLSSQPAKYENKEQKDSIVVLYDTIETDLFDEAVEIIKQFEGWHGKEHYPYVGYGHQLLAGEKWDHTISEANATELVRSDLRKKCAVFRSFGKDSLLLGVLAYNIGEYKLINADGTPKTKLVTKLAAGDRDIYSEYISYRKAWGRVIPSIERRRKTEYDQLFNKTHVTIR